MEPVTLASLLIQLNAIKADIRSILSDRTSCVCDQIRNSRYRNDIGSIDKILTVESIDAIVQDGVHLTCTRCEKLSALYSQLKLLKSQVYDKINSDYALDPSTNPFII